MKKISLIILLFILFSCIQVDALSNSHIEPSNEIILENIAADYLKSEKLDDGYIILNGYSISRINNDGTVKWSKTNPNDFKEDPFDFIVKDNKVVLSHCRSANYQELVSSLNHSVIDNSSWDEYTECGTIELNINTGEIIKRNKQFGGYVLLSIGDNYVVSSPSGTFLLNNELEAIKANPSKAVNMLIDDNKIYLMELTEGKIVVLDENLNTLEEKSINYSNCEGISGVRVYNFKKYNNEFYVVDGNIYKIDSNNKCLISYDANSSSTKKWYYAITFTDKHILLGGVLDNEDTCTYSTIESNRGEGEMCFPAIISVFDKDFNYIEDIKTKSNKSATITNLTYSNGSILAKWLWEEYYLGLTEYNYKYLIETEKQENGSVEVVDSAFPGDNITFKVIAKEGYTLKFIKIIGVKTGTVIEINSSDLDLTDALKGYYVVSNNEFLMPDEDVIIETVFEKEETNPDTGVPLAFPLILLFSTGLILLIYSIKNTKRYL